MRADDDANSNERWALAWIAVAVAVFCLNDFALLATRTYGGWVATDYGFRLIIVAVVLAPPSVRRWSVSSGQRHTTRVETTVQTVAIAVLAALTLYVGTHQLADIWPASRLQDLPRVRSGALYWIDLTFGLILVAVSEELVFRKLLWQALTKFGWHNAWKVLVSSFAFALAHWSYGIGAVASTFLAGVLFMLLYRSTGILAPCIVAHYLVNLFIFAR